MKGASKIGLQFGAKFSPILSKLKDNSTLKIAHEQAKALFGQYQFKDILIPFISKMDTGDQLSDKQRKQLCKVYISFIDTFKDQILQQSSYEKLIQSINRKQSGVSEVIGHICKSLLNRIQDQETLFPYISFIINTFLHHPQMPKILKQLIQTIEPNLIASLQEHILSILNEKVGSSKSKNDFLDAILTLVLCLQQRIQTENQIKNFIIKFLRNDDWNCRKTSVDICHAMLLIRHQKDQATHAILRQLKYDKIKHVRQAVNNYQTLYKQIFDEDLIPKIQLKQNKITPKSNKINKAPAMQDNYLKQNNMSPREKLQKIHSLDRSNNKDKLKNQKFFENAKNSNVIKTNESNQSQIHKLEVYQDHSIRNNLSLNFVNKVASNASEISNQNRTPKSAEKQDFQVYLRNRNSPSQSANSKPQSNFNNFKQSGLDQTIPSSNKLQKEVPFNYKSQFQKFKKKNRVQEAEHIATQSSKQQSELQLSKSQQFNLSCIQTKQDQQAQQFHYLFACFEKKINQRLDRIQRRIDSLERNLVPKMDLNFSNRSSIAAQDISFPQGNTQNFINTDLNNVASARSQPQESYDIESNLQQKIKLSISHQNWDQAYTIALTNNKRNILLNLLQRCVFPKDKTVQQCILLQIRKLFGYMSALKWLKYYLMQKNIDLIRLKRFQQDLQARNSGDKNYMMMKQLLLNQIQQKIQSMK